MYRLLRPLLFCLDAERAHRCALRALRLRGRFPVAPMPSPEDGVVLMGLRFPNRVGLAAGFDKDARAIDGLWSLGFGFVEVGTVTPRAQPGNPRPRLHRLPAQQALVNSLGFPNDGLDAVVARLRRRTAAAGIVGVNIGKNADTPLDRAVDDYVACLRGVHAVADYVAVNISSPNTASLRELHQPAKLGPLLAALVQERHTLRMAGGRPLPLLLKVSPDLDEATLGDVAGALRDSGFDGVIATNSTVQRPVDDAPHTPGGLSGAPLRPLATQAVSRLRALLGPVFPIIGVGGIDSPAAAQAMRAAGADLVQVYTGMIYQGPALVRECVRALV